MIEHNTSSGITSTQTGTETPTNILPVENVTYEMGRDYNVAKNNKKNIRTKTTPTTLTGAEILTP